MTIKTEEKFFVNQDWNAVKISDFKWKYSISKEKGFNLINILNSDGTIIDSFVIHWEKELNKIKSNLKKSHWIELKVVKRKNVCIIM